jgi:hypothetical protein
VNKNEWNNLLHNQIESTLRCVLEGKSTDLKDSLFVDGHFIDFLAQCGEQPDYRFPTKGKRGVRKGYLGHLTKLANLIRNLAERDAQIADYLKSST